MIISSYSMRHLAAIVLCFYATVTVAQTKPVSPSADYKDQGLVYEKIAWGYDFSADGSNLHHMSARVRVQSEAGVKLAGLLIFHYQRDFETVSLQVRVHKPDGTMVETPPDSVLDMPSDITRQAPFYSDLYEKHVTVKALAVGDLLEYTFSSRERPLIPGQFWINYNFDHNDIVLDEQFIVSVPADREVKTKSPGAAPVVKTEGAARTYVWTSSNLTQKTDKQRQAEQAANATKVADVQVSSYRSWAEVGEAYDSLQKDRVVVTPEIQAKANELTAGLMKPADKARALYRYVALNFRYAAIDFGLGRLQPHSAAEVMGNGYGDCKDKHTLLAALLQAAGISAKAALTTYSRAFDADVPSLAQFNHVVTMASVDNEPVWLDTTVEVAPYGFLLSPLRGQHALVVAGEASKLIETPKSLSPPDGQTVNVVAKLDDKGTLTADFEIEARGDMEIAMRTAFRQVPQANWQELVQQISRAGGYAGTVSDVKLKTAPEDTSKEFAFTYHYKRDDFADWANLRILTACGGLLLPDGGEKDDPPAPVWFGTTVDSTCESDIELPAGYDATVPQNLDIFKPFGEFHLKYKDENGHVKSTRSLELTTREIALDQVMAYREFRKNVLESVQYIVLRSGTQTASSGQPAGSAPRIDFFAGAGDVPEANRVYEQGVALMGQNEVAAAQSKFQEAAKLDPKHPRAWAALASTFLMSGQTPRGIELLHKQLEEFPSPEIYKMLGMTLMSMHRNEEAVSVWKEAMKRYGDDRDMPANLGGALSALGRYEEAQPALESAVAMNPKSSALLFQLSLAYKQTGATDRSVATLHKAAELDSSPTMWNNLAFELADMNRNLDEAMLFAKQAVAEAQLRASTISIDTLTQTDLGAMPSLATFWDTLGWVHFRQGELQEAETYLRASWELEQHGEVADHLGQLYEAQKKSMLAKKYYEYALAAPGAFKDSEKRLAKLMPASSTRKAGVDRARGELSQDRTFHVPRLHNASGSAEFFIVFDSHSAIEGVKFIDGNTTMPAMAEPLKKAKFGFTLPPASNAKIVRRGMMMCTPPASSCDFVVYTVDTVRNLY